MLISNYGKKVVKYCAIVILGLVLAVTYSYIIMHDFSAGITPTTMADINIQTIIVFFAMYCYLIGFMKLLFKLFN